MAIVYMSLHVTRQLGIKNGHLYFVCGCGNKHIYGSVNLISIFSTLGGIGRFHHCLMSGEGYACFLLAIVNKQLGKSANMTGFAPQQIK